MLAGGDYSRSDSQSALMASLGMCQSPRGERESPTLGPSGRQLRLNCCEKKRRRNVLSHFFMVASSYLPVSAARVLSCRMKACCAS